MSQKLHSDNLSNADITKILSEINQIHNERFQLTGSAITVFGVFIALVIPKEDGAVKQASELLFATPILLLIFLFLLFLYAHTLDRTLKALSTYLRVMEKSKWEKDFVAFKRNKGVGYFFVENTIFILLGIITSMFPFMLCYLNIVKFPASEKVGYLLIFVGLIYINVVLSILFFGQYEKRTLKIWEKLKKEGMI